MPNSIVITNRRATATTLVVDGVLTPISPSGTINIDEGSLIRVLSNPTAAQRFRPSGDLLHSDPPPSGGAATSFSATVDATVPGTTPLVPGVSGLRWETRRTRFAAASGSGSPSAAQVAVRSAGAIVQGISADASFVPLTSFAGLSTAPGAGLDVTVDSASTGGLLTVSVEVLGEYA